MIGALLAIAFVVIALRVCENILDLGLVTLAQWLSRRQIPAQLAQLRLELEVQRSGIPAQVRAKHQHPDCSCDTEEMIAKHLEQWDAGLDQVLGRAQDQLEARVGEVAPTSAWQFFALFGRPDITVRQLQGVAALIVPSQRN